ncbi:MAG: winged helix-turn-helix transcriptional regulator, partial [Bauldia sp.]|nr:winged helix-turn-helix transcriptional regulator [Bauldia sp.]
MKPNFLTINPEDSIEVLKGLASAVRVSILKTLHANGKLNVNEISRKLGLPQSTVATNVQMLEEAGLITTETVKAKKGHQKICSARFDEIIVRFEADKPQRQDNLVEVSMPLGLFTSIEVSAPCGLCSTEGVIGLLDVPDSFLDPNRVQAALIWFGRGSVEYKFPNNAKLLNSPVESVEFSMELSSEVPGTNMNWPSDITLWVNDFPVGTWTSPGDYGDKRGVYTPNWWKLKGSQYGKLKTWRVGKQGT